MKLCFFLNVGENLEENVVHILFFHVKMTFYTNKNINLDCKI